MYEEELSSIGVQMRLELCSLEKSRLVLLTEVRGSPKRAPASANDFGNFNCLGVTFWMSR